QLDHADGSNANDVITLGFGFKATDSDGDAASGTITVSVKDDAPIAVNDTRTVLSSQDVVTGNVTVNDTVGADSPGYTVKSVTFAGVTYAVPVSGNINVTGAYGVLTIGSDGSYSYDVSTPSAGGTDVFAYKILDRDGDSATANLSLTVQDRIVPPQTPNLNVQDVCVYEDRGVQLVMTSSARGGDGDEVLTVSVSGIKPGWYVDTALSGGSYNSSTGVWTITLAAGQSLVRGPAVFPPSNSDVDMLGLLTATASVYDPDSGLTAQSSASFKVVTDAVADAPNLYVDDAVAIGVTSVVLPISVSLRDVDGSEVIKEVRIEGVPSTLTLSAGSYDSAHGVWVLAPSQLSGLKINAPSGYSGNLVLTVTAVSEERNLSGEERDFDNNLAYTSDTIGVTFVNESYSQSQTQSQTLTVYNEVTVTSGSSVTLSSGVEDRVHVSVAQGQSVVAIHGFDPGEGDVLDLSNLVQNYDELASAIADFVYARSEGGNTIISVDPDGAGSGFNSYDVAVLHGVASVAHVEDVVQLTQQQQTQV
ncbi:MAG: type I secretion C-terminal target domain-containing protein, partial [Alphaproteobacteria bacterium]|nr:type I secretion C-terminal target domain-containing protein [Alphaproteobacteria bacterium]